MDAPLQLKLYFILLLLLLSVCRNLKKIKYHFITDFIVTVYFFSKLKLMKFLVESDINAPELFIAQT